MTERERESASEVWPPGNGSAPPDGFHARSPGTAPARRYDGRMPGAPRIAVATALAATLLASASSLHAQQPPAPGPGPGPTSGPTSLAGLPPLWISPPSPSPGQDAAWLAPFVASTPLRLSLLASVYPLGPAFTGSGCGEASVAAAGSIFPVQPYWLVPLTPHLVLHGFSDLGCPGDPSASLDGGAGAGLTYALPVRKSLWLVGSAGVYGVPAHGTGTPWAQSGAGRGVPPRGSAEVRVDVVKRVQGDRTLSFGLGAGSTSTPDRRTRLVPSIGGSF